MAELLKQKDATKEALAAKSEDLGKAAQKLGEMMYQQAQAAQGGGAQPGAGAGPQGGASQGGGQQDEKVVDAEFTEVKSDKK